MKEKLNNFAIKHPAIFAIIAAIIVSYPFIVILHHVWFCLTTFIHNTFFWQNGGEFWRPFDYEYLIDMLKYSIPSWIIYTALCSFTIAKPFSKFGTFYSTKKLFIDPIIFYIFPVYAGIEAHCLIECIISMTVIIASYYGTTFAAVYLQKRKMEKIFREEMSMLQVEDSNKF